MSSFRPRRPLFLLLICALFTVLAFIPASAQDNSQSTQTVHVVQRGENLYRIALHYGVSMDSIIQANNITDPTRIFAGQQLVIPNFDSTPATVENPLVAGTPIYHTVVYGDTVQSIAQQYGMTPDQLMQINNITNPDMIYRGQQLTVWATTDVEPSDSNSAQVNVSQTASVDLAATTPSQPAAAAPSTTYVIQPGDHLSEIAQRYNLTWPDIAKANNLNDPNQIFAGETLTIPGVANSTSTTTNASTTSIASAPIPDGMTAYDGIPAGITPYPPTIWTGKQIVVDLSHQMLYAYQDGVLIRAILVSTGLPGSPTVTGDYNVYVKYTAQRMVGPGYDLPDVPYVMYFYQGYGLHGTYWHHNFGHPMSHGCVNLPTPDAEWLYDNFVEVGTPVHVEY